MQRVVGGQLLLISRGMVAHAQLAELCKSQWQLLQPLLPVRREASYQRMEGVQCQGAWMLLAERHHLVKACCGSARQRMMITTTRPLVHATSPHPELSAQ